MLMKILSLEELEKVSFDKNMSLTELVTYCDRFVEVETYHPCLIYKEEFYFYVDMLPQNLSEIV